MKQVWHKYTDWEDYKNGMWKVVSTAEEKRLLQSAIDFTADHIRYGKAMMRAISEWPISSEHNLTDKLTNQQAWVGHAGASIEMNLPECVVRKAWGFLSQKQKDLANYQADLAIKFWRRNYNAKQDDRRQLLLSV